MSNKLTPQQIADDALSCCNTTQDASGFIEYYYQSTPESIRGEAQILLGHSKMAEQENERDAARRDSYLLHTVGGMTLAHVDESLMVLVGWWLKKLQNAVGALQSFPAAS